VKRFQPALVIAVLISTFAISVAATRPWDNAGPKDPDWPALLAITPPSVADTTAIRSVVEQADHAMGVAARTFDVAAFPTVFANDPAVPLSLVQADALVRIRAVQPGLTRGTGYLDFQLANFRYWEISAGRLERVQATAQAHGRPVTSEELRGITDPGMTFLPRRTDPLYTTPIPFLSITGDGNRAAVVGDTGSAVRRWALLRTSDGWRIVGERVAPGHG